MRIHLYFLALKAQARAPRDKKFIVLNDNISELGDSIGEVGPRHQHTRNVLSGHAQRAAPFPQVGRPTSSIVWSHEFKLLTERDTKMLF